MRTRRGALAAGVALLSVPVILAGMAWACSPAKTVYITDPVPDAPNQDQTITPGSTVSLTGSGWESGEIQVRWNSPTGPQLRTTGTAQGPSFSLRVTLPDRLTQGVTYKMFVAGASTPVSDADREKGINPIENVVPVKFISGQSAHSIDPTTGENPTVTPATPGAPGQVTQAATNDSVFEPTDATAAIPATAAARSGRLAVAPARDKASQAVAAPVAAADGTVIAVPQPVADEVAPAIPSAQTAGSDLWSGFAAGDRPGASLVDPASVPTANHGMGAGLAILGIGIVALLGGTAVALRRRPIKVTSTD
ncbi:MAG: hypothetical protein ACR2MO_14435 [Acidimicrobiales bacterium]